MVSTLSLRPTVWRLRSTGALARGPTEPIITDLEVEGGAGKEEDRDGVGRLRSIRLFAAVRGAAQMKE
jgi:hypothetical protein